MLVANLGLKELINISVPVMTAIYPPCIALVLLSLALSCFKNAKLMIAPAVLVSLIFGIIDGMKVSPFADVLPAALYHLPLANHSLSWLPPTLLVVVISFMIDKFIANPVD